MSNISIIKNNVPIYGDPKSEEHLKTVFKFYVAKLLSMKPENESEIDNALPVILDECRRMSINEVALMFTLYADNKLDIEPKTNYFNRVLVGHVRSAYRRYLKSKPQVQKDTYDKELQDYHSAITYFDSWAHNTPEIPYDMSWLYEYLIHTKKVMPEPVKSKRIFAYNNFKEEYGDRFDDETIKGLAKASLVKSWFHTLILKKTTLETILKENN